VVSAPFETFEKYSFKWESSQNRGEPKKYLKAPSSYLFLSDAFYLKYGKVAHFVVEFMGHA